LFLMEVLLIYLLLETLFDLLTEKNQTVRYMLPRPQDNPWWVARAEVG
jgi:hypothetical protein